MLALAAVCLIVLPGPVAAPFAPDGPYAGHWGIDVDIVPAAVVVAPVAGMVSFAGEVAGVRSVTIRSGHFRVSVSYLASVDIPVGVVVARGEPIGTAGDGRHHRGVHIGLRHGERYLDPVPFSCGSRATGTVRLLPPNLAAPAAKD